MKRLSCALAVLFLLAGRAFCADLVLFNGRITTLDAEQPEVSALAVSGGIVKAIGDVDDVRKQVSPDAELIDVGGRRIIPGLIDSHIHAIRAGLTYSQEAHWTGVRTITAALAHLVEKSRGLDAQAWIVVAGGWTSTQFAERRAPTRSEIEQALPGRKIYIQHLYRAVLLSTEAERALFEAGGAEAIARLRRDPATGWLTGDAREIAAVFDLLPRPEPAEADRSTKAFLERLASFGVTGVLDPGGYNLQVGDYGSIFRLWRAQALPIRVAFSVSAPRPNHELDDFIAMTSLMPMGFGDEWLRFNGIGENVTWGFYNNDHPTSDQAGQLEKLLLWAASRQFGVTFHWNNNASAHSLLDVLDRVNRSVDIAPLRWSIAHLHDATPATLARMRDLGVGWLMQNALYFRGEAFFAQFGEGALRRSPPIRTALELGLPVGAGTDAHRVMDPNPFIALQWLVDGKTIGGRPTRGERQLLSREQALRLYTQGSAWFSHDERRRGSLRPGMLADLAVLSKDILDCPVEDIGGATAILTMVGGKIVHRS